MAKLTLSTGSNLGDRAAALHRAAAEVEKRLGRVVYRSAVGETAAWGLHEQPDFLNQVLILEVDAVIHGPGIGTELHRILDVTQAIEREMGRRRELHWGPRSIDIDLIFLEDLRYEDHRVSLPHPWWRLRPFVTGMLPAESRWSRLCSR